MKELLAVLLSRRDQSTDWWELRVSEAHPHDTTPTERHFMFPLAVLLTYIRRRLGIEQEKTDVETVDTSTPADR